MAVRRAAARLGPERFRAELRPLIDHKNRSGMSAFVLSIEEIRRTTAGPDDAEKIKRTIASMVEQRGARYVFLVGDASLVPARHSTMWSVSGDNRAMTVQYFPTDNYYSNLYADESGQMSTVSAGRFGFVADGNHDASTSLTKRIISDPRIAWGSAAIDRTGVNFRPGTLDPTFTDGTVATADSMAADARARRQLARRPAAVLGEPRREP